MHYDEIITRTLLLDIETTRSGRIYHVGALFGDTVLEEKSISHPYAALRRLDEMAASAEFLLGHNLLGHDLPILQAQAPQLAILKKPVIDTLYLSPLAFPQNPYHRLVKDYKLVRSSINDPLADARLAASIFQEQMESFTTAAGKNPQRFDFFRFCFDKSRFNGFGGEGLSTVFSTLGAAGCASREEAAVIFAQQVSGLACRQSLPDTVSAILEDDRRRPALAYCLAWLLVSGSNSVLPPWVRHRFPEISVVLKALRDLSCGSDQCAYCRENHNPDKHLARFFGFPAFRRKPAAADGQSLQRAIVADGMRDRPLLAILPTGGGKSLCYQLPALVRHRRRGLLTVVISPLQALMKDQVDNLVKNTGTPFAEAVYGLLTPPERGAALERVRLGDAAILYIAPEQLRSRSIRHVLRQREIGCWVFDEAHCLSKWGHDFRPDYLYAARFIREFCTENNQMMPAVCGFTATAKLDVIDELITHFRDELEQDLKLFAGGVERDNLDFEVLSVTAAEKWARTCELVHDLIARDKDAGAVIYAATRRGTEEIRDYLRHQGIEIEAFHGGLPSKEKRDIIEAFVAGQIPVISATNAFGMGVDKENIRLVLHFDMPGSLENYIQEAGRAGRDRRAARCVLLYDPEDADRQFGIGALSEVKKREIERILRALRRVKRNKAGEIVITSGELLRDEELADIFEKKYEIRDTKVKTAVSWLERSGYLQRNQNLTEVFQGKPLVKDIAEAETRMAKLHLAPHTARLWTNILRVLFNQDDERGLSADVIAEGLFVERKELDRLTAATGLTPAQIVIKALHEMAEVRLLDRGILLSAILRCKGKNNARSILEAVTQIEGRLLAVMQAEDPDADDGGWVELNVHRLTQQLKNDGLDTSPHQIRSLVKGLSFDGKGLAATLGSIELRHQSRDRYAVRLQRSWDAIQKTVRLRHNVAHTILRELIRISQERSHKAGQEGSEVNVSFSSNALSKAVKGDITLAAEVKKILPAIDRALMFLHEQKAIHLQGGMAVLRQAMTIRLEPEAKRRRYSLGDFKPLSVHYREKRFQVHVMAEYASLGIEKIAGALALVLDYFSLGRVKFINKYFSDRKELIAKATTQESYRRIVERLGNPVQISCVGNHIDRNMLVLAGPGSGKTTIIVHRCAYLLQVERIPPRQILVLCFNHNAAISLRKRLIALIGKAARGLTVATYHGAAMRIAGISVRDIVSNTAGHKIDFDAIITQALKLLRGEIEIAGTEQDELRDQLLGGYSHILVDEYQDIDGDQYDLVAAIAGKSLKEGEGRLSILAVGDDDQNIYTFRGANVQFIRQFKSDYPAEVVYLVENYRSSGHIIAASNGLIANNRDRMKGDYPIRINRERERSDPGGTWARHDSVARGRVQVMGAMNPLHQALSVLSELERLQNLTSDFQLEGCAILSRTNGALAPIRSVLEEKNYPLRLPLQKSFPLPRVREMLAFMGSLENRADNTVTASAAMASVAERTAGDMNIWTGMLLKFLESYREETFDAELPVGWMLDRLYEYLAEQRREKTIGEGIFLGTIHTAKGMEFSHVFILDGDWSTPRSRQAWEEERRILYVAMTRAKENLVLMKSAQRANPLLRDVIGGSILTRQSAVPLASCNNRAIFRHEILGLGELFMDYAGGFPPKHPIHTRLAHLGTGSKVTLADTGEYIDIKDGENHTVGRLANEAAKTWRRRLETIEKVRVLAILQRTRKDPDEGILPYIKSESWELPLLEVVIRG